MALIAWYKFDNDCNDYSGNKNHGTSTGITYDYGRIGSAAVFNNSKYVIIHSPLIPSTGDFSVAFWFKMTSGTSTQCLGSTRYVVGDGFSIFYINKVIRIDTNLSHQWLTNYSPPLNQWIHLAFVKTSNSKILYINGVQQDFTSNTPQSPINIGARYTIGTSQYNNNDNTSDNFFKGLMDDYRIYNNALSLKQVHDLYLAKILHYKFDNPLEEPTENLMTNVNNGLAFTGAYDANGNYGFNETTNIKQEFLTSYLGKKNVTKVSRISSGKLHGEHVYRLTGSAHEPSSTYVYSFWYYGTYGTRIKPYCLGTNRMILSYLNENGEWVTNNSDNIIIPVPINQWYRVVIKLTNPSSTETAEGVGYMILHDNILNATLSTSHFWAFCDFQLEKKDHVTPFVKGIRNSKVYDCSGYNNHSAPLVLNRSPQWVTKSKIGPGAFSFDSTKSQYVLIANKQGKVTDQITVSAWAYRDNWQSSSNERIISCTEDGGWSIGFNDHAGYITFSLYANNTYGTTPKYAISNITPGWHLFTGTYDGRYVKLYIDGTLIETVDRGGKYPISYNSTNSVFIGAEPSDSETNPTGQYWNGLIDDVRIYATALSADDVRTLYESRASLDDHGNVFCSEFKEIKQPFPELKQRLNTGIITDILNIYTQAHCNVELVNDHVREDAYSFRIYRTPNVSQETHGSTMWGGIILNFNNYNRFVYNKKYKVSFYYKGQTSTELRSEDFYFAYRASYVSNGVGLQTGATKYTYYNQIPNNYNNWDDWQYCYAVFKADNLYQTGTDGNMYFCMRNLKIGWSYTPTGPLGTDIRIADLRIEELNNDDNYTYGVKENGTMMFDEINEITGINDPGVQHRIFNDGTLYINGELYEF